MSSKSLIVGASRTIGLALVDEYLARGWDVIGTVRGTARTGLHELAERSGGRLRVEVVDMTDDAELDALRERLRDVILDLLFVNAAVTNGDEPVEDVSRSVFVDVMTTNALAPMRVLEKLGSLVPETGTMGVMSSSQGSITLNTNGGHEVYRASKSALNQLMRSYASRQDCHGRSFLLINPGWVKTELGGAGAQLEISESVPGVVKTIEQHRGEPGLLFLDYRGEIVPW